MDFLRNNWQYIAICFIIVLVGIIILYKNNTFEYLENTSSITSYLNKDVSLECEYKNSKYYLSITPLSSCSNLKQDVGECITNVATLQKTFNTFSTFRISQSFSDTKKYKLMSIYNSRPYLSQNLHLANHGNMLCFDNGEGNMVYFEVDSNNNKYLLKFMKNDKPYYVTTCDKKCESNMRICLTEDISKALSFTINSMSSSGQQHADNDTGSIATGSMSDAETNKLPVNSEK